MPDTMPTFAAHAAQWLANHRRPDGEPIRDTTRRQYARIIHNHLDPTFGTTPLDHITPRMVDAWWDAFTPTHDTGNPSTRQRRRHRAHRLLHAILQSATRPGPDGEPPMLATNPCQPRPAPRTPTRTPTRPSRTDMRHLLEAFNDPAMRLTALLCDTLGLREGEALGARRIDIDTGGHPVLHVRVQAQRTPLPDGGWATRLTPPKTPTSIRDIPLPAWLATRLAAWEEEHPASPDTPLTALPDGTPRTPQSYRMAFRRAAHRAGLDWLHPHDLRRDCLSRLMEAGGTLGEVMALGGHASLAAATRYQVADMNRLRRLMDTQRDGMPDR